MTNSDWVDSNDKVLLNEESTFVFEGTGNFRSIERTTKLTAHKIATFEENKEGLIGLHLDRAFEEPSTKPDKNASPVKIVLKVGESIVFKHKIVIGGDLSDDDLNKLKENFN